MLKVVRSILYFLLCKVIFRVKYINLGKKERIKPIHVICSNHFDWMDPVILWTRGENVKVMAKAELFKVPIWSAFIRKMGAFPINRGQKDARSLYHAVKILKEGNNLIIFPEGTRKAKIKNVKAKIGTVYVAIASGADIQPVYIEESKRRLFGRIRVVYGEAYNLSEYKDRIKDKDLLNELTEDLMNRIYSLREQIK